MIFGTDGNEVKLLFIERGIEPFKGMWAFPGGFLDMKETTLECARRELFEETGLKEAFLEQLGVYSDVDRDPRGRTITIAYIALVPLSDVRGGDDAAKAKWFSLGELPELAFDHAKILADALDYAKQKNLF